MLAGRQKYFHPYEPYSVQLEFMHALYDALEQGSIGIFESPTGTGKSLSLVCAAITWLRTYKARHGPYAVETNGDDRTAESDEPQWVRDQARQERVRDALNMQAMLEERLQQARKLKDQRILKRQRVSDTVSTDKNSDGHLQYLVDPYEEADRGQHVPGFNFSDNVTKLLYSAEHPLTANHTRESEPQAPKELKIFFASRTHSQLSQIVGELKRLEIPGPNYETFDLSQTSAKGIMHVPLAGRKAMCINPAVRKLGSATAMNERCLEMQRESSKSCDYMTKYSNTLNELADDILSEVQDIEDIVGIGKRMHTCPYYASRRAISDAEIVTLPYPLLLNESARNALDIDLKGQVVIIDEAHNLVDVLTEMNSTSVTFAHLSIAERQLEAYLARFKNRLSGLNKVHIQQLCRVIKSLKAYLQSALASSHPHGKDTHRILSVSELLTSHGVDQVNLYELDRYMTQSRIARKVDGYAVYEHSQQEGKNSKPAMPVLLHIQQFLLSLLNLSQEGCLFCEHASSGQQMQFRYMLLDPAYAFSKLVQDARAVILAGGTMSPRDQFEMFLFNDSQSRQRLKYLTCGHVVPKENIACYAISHGIHGNLIEVTFQKRNDRHLLLDIGDTIVEICKRVPDGVIVFLPSFQYMYDLLTAWRQAAVGSASTVFARLEAQKKVFQEPRDTNQVETTLNAYASCINAKSSNGALLFAVVGGKMSEGLNFSDRLGRGIVMIGMPFPNAHTPDMQEKLRYTKEFHGSSAASGLMEAMCMRSVNQSVGRAIRHKSDFAAIFLLDSRYAKPRTLSQLPKWLQSSLHVVDNTRTAMNSVSEFFKLKPRS